MRSTRRTVPLLRPDLGPRPREPVPSHACSHQCATPQQALVEELHLPGTKAVDRVRIGGVVRRKSSSIGSFGLMCRGTADGTGGSTKPAARSRAGPRLGGVKKRGLG